jgi:hypothetical protein
LNTVAGTRNVSIFVIKISQILLYYLHFISSQDLFVTTNLFEQETLIIETDFLHGTHFVLSASHLPEVILHDA